MQLKNSSYKGIQIESRSLLFLFLFFSSIFTLHWIHYDLAGWKASLLVLGALALSIFPSRFWPEDFTIAWPDSPISPKGILFGLFAYLPLALHLMISWRSEFPFGGDNSFHVFTATTYYRFLTRMAPALLVDLTILSFGLLLLFCILKLPTCKIRISLSSWIYVPACLILWGSSFFISFAEEQMRSYPQMFYVLSIFFQSIAHLFKWEEPYNAYRISNALAPLTWAFILRPLFLKKWPDFSLLFFSVFFYWRWPSLYFFTGNYLESWALVFIFMALEKFFTSDSDNYWISFFLLGVSTLFKEIGLFFFPFLTLLILVLPGRKKIASIVSGIMCSIPFVLYYFHRNYKGQLRSYQLDTWERLIQPYRMQETYSRVQFFLGPTPILLLIVLGAMITIFALTRADHFRKKFLVILFIMVGFFLFFFYSDTTITFYEGYPRFQFYWVFILGLLFIACLQQIKNAWLNYSLFLLFFTLNAYGTYEYLKISDGDDFRRSTLENYDAASYYPINKLLKQISKREIKYETIVLSTERFFPYDTERVYGLEKKVLSLGVPGANKEWCACSNNDDLFLFLHEIPQNLLLNTSESTVRKKAIADLKERAGQLEKCQEKLTRTCKVLIFERTKAGEVWGMAGWGLRLFDE